MPGEIIILSALTFYSNVHMNNMDENNRSFAFDVDYVLMRINEAFQVADISKSLKKARDINEAKSISKNEGFTRVPIFNENGRTKEYYDGRTGNMVPIETDLEILSDCEGLLKIIPALEDNEFYFVLTGNKISKIVHFSDLNSPIVSIGIYAQLNYLEISIRDFIRRTIGNDEETQMSYLEKNLPKKKFEKINKQYENKKDQDAHIDPVNELYIDQELLLARHLNLTEIDDKTIDDFTKMRNSLAHSSDIVKNHEDVRRWNNFLRESMKIIQNIRAKTYGT